MNCQLLLYCELNNKNLIDNCFVKFDTLDLFLTDIRPTKKEHYKSINNLKYDIRIKNSKWLDHNKDVIYLISLGFNLNLDLVFQIIF